MTVAHLAGHEDIVSLIQNKAYGKVPFKDLPDDISAAILSSMGCIFHEPATGLSEVLDLIVSENNESDAISTLQEELPHWEMNESFSFGEIRSRLREMNGQGLDEGLIALASEKRVFEDFISA